MTREIRCAMAWLFFGTIGCIVAYLWLDKPIAFWVFDNQLNHIYFLKQVRFIPVILAGMAFIAFFWLMFRFCQEKFGYKERTALLLVNAIALTYFFKSALKVIFGRYGPITLLHYKPSLFGVNEGKYGFNWFHAGIGYGAFPSGHAAVMAAGMMALSLSYPKWRWFFFLLWVVVAINLVGMNYHFVSDVIGGGVLGVLLTYFADYAITKGFVES